MAKNQWTIVEQRHLANVDQLDKDVVFAVFVAFALLYGIRGVQRPTFYGPALFVEFSARPGLPWPVYFHQVDLQF